MTIKILKLVSGEELAVEITEENDSSVTFKNPVACVLQRSQQTGGAALGFMPWMHAADGPFTVDKSKIICAANVADGSLDKYVVDVKEYSKSFSVNQDVWAKIVTDTLRVDPEKSPVIMLVLGETKKV